MADPKWEDTQEVSYTPSWDDTVEHSTNEPSQAEALRRGITSGGTLGFSDELGGGVQAFLDSVLGGVTDVDKRLTEQGFKGDLLPSTQDLYVQARDEERAAEKAASEAHPATYTVGNIAGSLPLAAAASAGMLGKGVQTLAAGKELVGPGISGATLRALPSISGAVKLGLAGGAISGLGGSEATDIPSAIRDIASGAGVGALAGGVGQGALSGAAKLKEGFKGLPEFISERSRLAQLFGKAKAQGEEGVNLIGPKGLEQAATNLEEFAPKMVTVLEKVRRDAWEPIQAKIDAFDASGQKLDFSKIGKEVIEELRSRAGGEINPSVEKDILKVVDILDNQFKGKEVPVEIRQMFKTFKPGDIKRIPSTQSGMQQADEIIGQWKAGDEAAGVNARYNIVPSKDGKYLTVQRTVDEQIGAVERPIVDPESGQTLGLTYSSLKDLPDNFKSSLNQRVIKNIPGSPEMAQEIPGETEVGELVKTITRREGGTDQLAAQQAQKLKTTMEGLVYTGENVPAELATQEGRRVASDVARSTKEILEQGAGITAQDRQKYAAAKAAQEMLKFDASDFKFNPATGERELDQSAEATLRRIIRRSAAQTDTGEDASKLIRDALEQVRVASPEVADTLAPEITKAAERLELAKTASKAGFLRQFGNLPALTVKAGNLAGMGIKKLTDLSKADDSTLGTIVKTLGSGSEKSQKAAKVIGSMVGKDNIARNAILFSAMQDPTLREELKQWFPGGTENEKVK